jgi:hypothetical protein
MLIYELLTNIYIAMYLYDMAVESNASKPIITILDHVISSAGNILIHLNKNFMFSSTQDAEVRTNIVRDFNEKAQKVKNSSDRINILDEQVRDLKSQLSSSNSTFKTQYKKSQKAKIYEYIVLGIFIISLLVIISVSWSPIEKNTKLLINTGALAILIISAYIAERLNRRNIEGFSGEYLPDGKTQSDSGVTKDDKDSKIISDENTYKNEMLDFLTISIYLAIMLESGNTYTGINSAMKREISYFNQMANMMDNTNTRLDKASVLTRIDSMTSSARITFFVSLGIVIGGAITAYTLSQDNLKYQPYILGITGLLILMVISRYIYDISMIVRNDPSKFYWKKPYDTSKLD